MAGGVIAVVVVALGVHSLFAIDTPSFLSGPKNYIRHWAEKKVSGLLGTSFHTQNFSVHLSGLSPELDLYGVVVDGAPPYPTPPLLRVDHIHMGIKITSLLHLTWYLQDLRADHPVAYVLTDAQGRSNLPKAKNTGQKSSTNVFTLGVRHAVFDRGEVYYNDRKASLDADVHDLAVQTSFNTTQNSYSGTLSYQNGHVKFGSPRRTIEHDLNAQFTASPDGLVLQRAVLSSGPSRVVVKASLHNYSQPNLEGQYQATIDTGHFRATLKDPTLPSGVIESAGTVSYASEPNRPMLDTLKVNGDLSSKGLHLASPQFGGSITDVAAHYSIANGNLDVSGLRGNLLGGQVTGTLTMANLAGATRSHLTASLRSLSLSDLVPVVAGPTPRAVSLRGDVNAVAEATWGKNISDIVASTDATISAHVAPTNGNPGTLTVNGKIRARYSGRTKQLTIERSFIQMPQTSVALNGTISKRSSLAVRMQSQNLHELESVAEMFRASSAGQPAKPLDLYGTGSFAGRVSGSTSAPHVTGQLQAANLRVKNTSWRSLRTGLDLSPSGVTLNNGRLNAAQRGSVSFDVSIGLDKWSFTNTSPLQASVQASELQVADFAKATGMATQVSGVLSANIDLHGSELSPVGQGDIRLVQASVAKQFLRSVQLKLNATGNAISGTLAAKLPTGTANASGTYYPERRAYEAQLQASGVQIAELQPVKARNLAVKGMLTLYVAGSGTIDNPGLNATLEIPKLDVKDQSISGIVLKAAVANHVGSFTVDSSALNSQVHGQGRVELVGEYQSDITLDTQTIPLAPLVAAYAPSQEGEIQGQTELHARIWGPLKDLSQLHGQAVVPTLSLSYKNKVNIGAAKPIRIDYANGVLQVQRSELRGTDTDLELQASVPIKSTAPAAVLLMGNIDLGLAQLLNPDITSSGQLQLHIDSFGQRGNPNVQGVINVVNASFTTGTLPVGLQNGNGVLTLTKDRLDITSFHATVGGGDFTASGGIVYRPGVRFDVALVGQQIRVLYNNVRAGFDTHLALTGTTDNAQLNGRVRLNQLQFTPSFDLSNFMSDMGGGAPVPPPTGGFSQSLKLDVDVASTSGINLVSRTLSLQGSANLHVTGTAAEPVILGRVNLSGGDLTFNNNRYVLQGGTVELVNPSRTEPVFNVSASTTVQQYNINIRLWGPSDNLHTTFTSDPSLPPSDVINLLAGMQTAEASQANVSPPGSLAAEQAIASQVASQVTSRFEKIAGISQLSIDPVLRTNSGQSPGARITVQQRVTSKIFVTFQTDVTSTSPQNNVVQLKYNKSRRLSFSGSREQNGGFGFEARIHKEW